MQLQNYEFGEARVCQRVVLQATQSGNKTGQIGAENKIEEKESGQKKGQRRKERWQSLCEGL